MIQSATPSEESVDAALRAELAQGDAVLHSAAPVMRHLLSGAQHAVFADEIVARVRGSMADLARQLLDAGAAEQGEPLAHDPATLCEVVARLTEIPGLLGHVHSLALEWQLSERLHAGLALDPALPPLLEALLASNDPTTSTLAMNLLAAQARFAQTQRRMQLPLIELPADLLHGALEALRGVGGHGVAESSIRGRYDEGRTRLALTSRIVTGMGSGAVAALALSHAGVAIFATALAAASGQDRDVVIFSTSEGQAVRLALALRMAGLKRSAIEEQLLILHPDALPAVNWDRVGPDRAAALLAIPMPAAGA